MASNEPVGLKKYLGFKKLWNKFTRAIQSIFQPKWRSRRLPIAALLLVFVAGGIIGIKNLRHPQALSSAPTITQFPLPETPGTPYPKPSGITVGPDGNLWFTEVDSGKIGKITPNGSISEFPGIHFTSGSIGDITTGSDGNLWFTGSEDNTNYAQSIGQITTDGTITYYPIHPQVNPQTDPFIDASGITSGPDGNIWFTEQDIDKIGKITPSGLVTDLNRSGVLRSGY